MWRAPRTSARGLKSIPGVVNRLKVMSKDSECFFIVAVSERMILVQMIVETFFAEEEECKATPDD